MRYCFIILVALWTTLSLGYVCGQSIKTTPCPKPKTTEEYLPYTQTKVLNKMRGDCISHIITNVVEKYKKSKDTIYLNIYQKIYLANEKRIAQGDEVVYVCVSGSILLFDNFSHIINYLLVSNNRVLCEHIVKSIVCNNDDFATSKARYEATLSDINWMRSEAKKLKFSKEQSMFLENKIIKEILRLTPK